MLFSVFRPFLFRVQKKNIYLAISYFFENLNAPHGGYYICSCWVKKKNIGKWQISKVHVSFAYSKVVRVSWVRCRSNRYRNTRNRNPSKMKKKNRKIINMSRVDQMKIYVTLTSRPGALMSRGMGPHKSSPMVWPDCLRMRLGFSKFHSLSPFLIWK